MVVEVIYLLESYIYDIASEDGRQFTCTRRGQYGEEANAPPETLLLTLGQEPDKTVWGKSLAGLYRQLTERITEHLLMT